MATTIIVDGNLYIKTNYTPDNFKAYQDVLGNQIDYDYASSSGLAAEWAVIYAGTTKINNYVGTNQLLGLTNDQSQKDIIEAARWETTSTPQNLTYFDIVLAWIKTRIIAFIKPLLKSIGSFILYIVLILLALYSLYRLIKYLIKKRKP